MIVIGVVKVKKGRTKGDRIGLKDNNFCVIEDSSKQQFTVVIV